MNRNPILRRARAPLTAREACRSTLSVLLASLVAVTGCSSPGPQPASASPPPATTSADAQPLAPVGQGFNLNASDIRFILKQIQIAENHAAGGSLLGPGPNQVPDPRLPYGLRTVDGSFNNLVPGQERFGAADRVFPRLAPPTLPRRRGAAAGGSARRRPRRTSRRGRRLRLAAAHRSSNLIVDQTADEPGGGRRPPGRAPSPTRPGTLFIPNVAPDVGLSAPYNSMFTLFGQFFDHGLDLVTKGGSGTVFVPLQPDDPLFVAGEPDELHGAHPRHEPAGPGRRRSGTARRHPTKETNTTTPFVDQNQTYTSHPSHQVFLREYASTPAAGRSRPAGSSTARSPGNIGNWGEVKAQARDDARHPRSPTPTSSTCRCSPPTLRPLPARPERLPAARHLPAALVEGNPADARSPPPTAVKTGHAFLDDIAHSAVPTAGLAPDADAVARHRRDAAARRHLRRRAARRRTSSPATAAATRTSASPRSTPSSTPSTTGSSHDIARARSTATLTPAETAEWKRR